MVGFPFKTVVGVLLINSTLMGQRNLGSHSFSHYFIIGPSFATGLSSGNSKTIATTRHLFRLQLKSGN